MGLMDYAVSMLAWSEKRLEVSSQNIANMGSTGYKSHVAFQSLLKPAADGEGSMPGPVVATDFAQGKVRETGNSYDIAIGADGFFQVRSGDDVRYTRDGHFTRDADGRLVNDAGFSLQAEGRDIVLHSNAISILADGTVLDDGEPVARITVSDVTEKARMQPVGGNAYTIASMDDLIDVKDPGLRQGALETSNVSTEREMLAMMSAIRSAEMGQRTVQLYDELMGRAADTFGGRGQ